MPNLFYTGFGGLFRAAVYASCTKRLWCSRRNLFATAVNRGVATCGWRLGIERLYAPQQTDVDKSAPRRYADNTTFISLARRRRRRKNPRRLCEINQPALSPKTFPRAAAARWQHDGRQIDGMWCAVPATRADINCLLIRRSAAVGRPPRCFLCLAAFACNGAAQIDLRRVGFLSLFHSAVSLQTASIWLCRSSHARHAEFSSRSASVFHQQHINERNICVA